MNTRLINPKQRMTTLQFQNGITPYTIEYKFDADSVVHGVRSTARFEDSAAGFSAIIGIGFNISRLTVTTPANGLRPEGLVHFYSGPHPLSPDASKAPLLAFMDTAFDAMLVIAGTKFSIIGAATDDTPFGGSATVRWNTVSEWLNFTQPTLR